MSLEVIDLTPLVGSEVRAPLESLLSGVHADLLRDLLEGRGVLLFREINLSDEQQVQFGSTLAEVMPHGQKGILKITLDERLNEQADYLRSSYLWHFDGFSDALPQRATMLSARKLASEGGQTHFAST